MEAYNNGTDIEMHHLAAYECTEQLSRLANAALERYGLEAASLEVALPAEDLFTVTVHTVAGSTVHHYLGRLQGKRFMLRIVRDSAGLAAVQAELVTLAALLRDTDLVLPEPVPACNGALVPQLQGAGEFGRLHCVLLRCPEEVGPEPAARQAAGRNPVLSTR